MKYRRRLYTLLLTPKTPGGREVKKGREERKANMTGAERKSSGGAGGKKREDNVRGTSQNRKN